jgi:death-on-curing protein
VTRYLRACRIAWNHPLPDGNKRAAWACLVLFIDLNDGSWNNEQPDTEDAVEAMLAVAAREVDETWLANWLRERITFRT